ncbi:MAG: cation:proton antiporter [Clostridia bacterium]|nr:cation:proton antiporter [Clostridia bacterium]
MTELNPLIHDLAYILAVAGITTLVFKKIRQPVVLGYIVAGFLTSPNFPLTPTIIDGAGVESWAEIGIVFLMFALGLEFSFHKIAKVGGTAIITAITVIVSMIFVGILTGTLLGFSTMDSVFLGGMISMSSTMIILKAYEEMKLKNERFAQTVLGVLVIEDIAGIFMMIILTTVSVGKSVSGPELFRTIGLLLIILVVILIAGIYLMPSFLKKTRGLMNNETLLIIALAFCFIMVVIAHRTGFSDALGAFLAGSILAGTTFAERIDKLIQPLKDLFGAIFFVSVGMLVVPSMLVEHIVPILVITAVTIVGQNLFSTIGALLAGLSLHSAIRTGFSMVQVGEFSFIIASLGMNLGVTSSSLYPIIVCVCVITTFTTPMFIKSGEAAYEKVNRHLPKKLKAALKKYNSGSRSAGDDNDWKEFISKTFIRLLTSGSAMFIIIFFGSTIVEPWLSQYAEKAFADAMIAVCSIAFMIPFIDMLYSRKRVLFTKLWLKNPANRVPLIFFNALKMFMCIMAVMYTIAHYTPIPYWGGVLAGFVFVAIVVRSELVRSKTLEIEMRFVQNFNDKVLENAKAKRKNAGRSNWIDEAIYAVTFEVRDNIVQNPDVNHVMDFAARPVFGVMLIQIKRDGRVINLPRAEETIEPGDRISAIGSKKQLESYVLHLEQSVFINAPEHNMVTLREFMYTQVYDGVPPEKQLFSCMFPVKRGSMLDRTTLKTSNFTQTYGGFIVGIEKEMLPVVLPEANVSIYEGDMVCVLGTQKVINKLLKTGLLSA